MDSFLLNVIRKNKITFRQVLYKLKFSEINLIAMLLNSISSLLFSFVHLFFSENEA